MQYIPKINGEIPPEEEAVSDHERLRNRLEMFDFTEVKVPGDGNCQVYFFIRRSFWKN
jgi:hypothetical protein